MPERRKAKPRQGNHRVSVLLAEDQTVLRDGIARLLEPAADLKVVASVADGSAAVRDIERLAPRVAVLGMALQGLNGIEACRVISEKTPGTAVVLLSGRSSPLIVRRAIESGALGFLTKESSGQELLQAIRAVAAGKRFLGRGIAETFAHAPRGAHRGDQAVETLTSTERNILRLVADGKSNGEVAEVLELSPRTVETYRMRLMRKLAIDNFAGLVKYAIRNGLVTLD